MMQQNSGYNTPMAGMSSQSSYNTMHVQQNTITQTFTQQHTQIHQVQQQVPRPHSMGQGPMGPHSTQMRDHGPTMGPQQLPNGGARPQMRPQAAQMRPEMPLSEVYVHQRSQ